MTQFYYQHNFKISKAYNNSTKVDKHGFINLTVSTKTSNFENHQKDKKRFKTQNIQNIERK